MDTALALAGFATVLILGALGLAAYTIYAMTEEVRSASEKTNRAWLEAADLMEGALRGAITGLREAQTEAIEQLHLAQLESNQRASAILDQAFDRIMSKSVSEAVNAAHLRDQSKITNRRLQDELEHAVSASKPKAKQQVTVQMANGEERVLDEDEISAL